MGVKRGDVISNAVPNSMITGGRKRFRAPAPCLDQNGRSLPQDAHPAHRSGVQSNPQTPAPRQGTQSFQNGPATGPSGDVSLSRGQPEGNPAAERQTPWTRHSKEWLASPAASMPGATDQTADATQSTDRQQARRMEPPLSVHATQQRLACPGRVGVGWPPTPAPREPAGSRRQGRAQHAKAATDSPLQFARRPSESYPATLNSKLN